MRTGGFTSTNVIVVAVASVPHRQLAHIARYPDGLAEPRQKRRRDGAERIELELDLMDRRRLRGSRAETPTGYGASCVYRHGI